MTTTKSHLKTHDSLKQRIVDLEYRLEEIENKLNDLLCKIDELNDLSIEC